MRLPFCDYHISAFWAGHVKTQKPLDLALSDYFRSHKSIGAHDRRTIGETLYSMVRWKSLIDHICPSSNILDRLYYFRKISLETALTDPTLPAHARLGISEFLYEKFVTIFGEEKAANVCRTLNETAPTTIRVNTLKTTREELLTLWTNQYAPALCKKAPHGLQFSKREPLFSLPEFKAGFFEVQDEGSQLVSELVKAKPGDHVLDYCSGSGGKTLAFAPLMQGKGQIYLHDTRESALIEARKRLKRAGVQNAQFVMPKKKMDWILADVPCSGTGTLRRNPDAKWKIDAPLIDRLVLLQREIVAKAIVHLKDDGHFVYSTCSILPEENEMQVEYFIKHHQLTLVGEPFLLLPETDGPDGFFAAVFKKQALV